MTWKIVTDKTQKIICRSAVRSALDPEMRNLSLDPMKTTDVKILEPPPVDSPSPAATSDEHDPAQVVYFRDHGEKHRTTVGDKFKSVITNNKGEPLKDNLGNVMH